jgi:hypothetical protein
MSSSQGAYVNWAKRPVPGDGDYACEASISRTPCGFDESDGFFVVGPTITMVWLVGLLAGAIIVILSKTLRL